MANKTEKKKQTKKEKRLGIDTVSSCEYVSIGHPDSTADAISSAILDEYLKKDPNTRYAVECQIKDFTVNLAGEVTSKARFSKSDIETIVKYTIARIGYSEEYARMWPKNATLDASRVTVNQYISKQSPNIAQGVDKDGYGDQGCIKKGTLISTAQGFKKIEDVKKGDYVIVRDKKYRVHNAWKTGTLGTVVLETNLGRRLTLTPDHRVYSNGEWIEAKDMVGRPIESLQEDVYGNKTFKVNMRSTEVERKFCKNKINGDGKELVLNEDLAYLMGFLAGDGSVAQDRFFAFTCNLKDKKEAIVPKIRRVFQDSDTKVRDNGINVFGVLYREALEKLGVEKVGALYKCVPFAILQSSKEIQCAFIRGLFDADGTVILHKGGHGTSCCRIRIGSISRRLIEDVMLMLRNMGIDSCILLHMKANEKLKIPLHHDCWVCNIRGYRSKEKFANLIGFDVSYKKNRLAKFMAEDKARMIHMDVQEKVTKITKGEVCDVYDIGVDEVHCFYANGILVHNCFVGMATGDKHFDHFTESRWLSQIIGQMLYAKALHGTLKIGLDIKTLVTVKNDMATQVIIAAPMLPKHEKEARKEINEVVRRIIQHPCEIIINGTGAYVVHSSVGDCGMTGRKLAVNFYGTDCPIGGGAVFGKDPTKADVCLNLLARHLARQAVMQKSWDKDIRAPFDHLSNRAIIKIHCCIGRKEIGVSLFDGYGRLISNESHNIPPSRVIGSLGLRQPIYFEMCRDGLFSKVDEMPILDLDARRKRAAKKGKRA